MLDLLLYLALSGHRKGAMNENQQNDGGDVALAPPHAANQNAEDAITNEKWVVLLRIYCLRGYWGMVVYFVCDSNLKEMHFSPC